MGTGKCLLRMAYRLSPEVTGRRGTFRAALSSSNRGGMGICCTWQGPERVPMGQRRCCHGQRLFLCQFQTRPWQLYQGRQPDNEPHGNIPAQQQWTVRYGGKCGGMDKHHLYRGWSGGNERHQSTTEIQCRYRRPVPTEEEECARWLVERP